MTKPRDDRSLRIATVLLRKTDRWVALYATVSILLILRLFRGIKEPE